MANATEATRVIADFGFPAHAEKVSVTYSNSVWSILDSVARTIGIGVKATLVTITNMLLLEPLHIWKVVSLMGLSILR